LVVDDEIDILETIVESFELELEGKDFSISFTDLPKDALSMFSEGRHFDIVVTDLNMPLMDGFELSQKIISMHKDMPIIVFTGHGGAIELDKLRAIGVNTMINKPNIKDLVESISQKLQLLY
jgi:two-component system capsular synthesis sensor histidine kinase RcsC